MIIYSLMSLSDPIYRVLLPFLLAAAPWRSHALGLELLRMIEEES